MMINEAVYRCMAVDIGLGFEEGLPGFQFFQVVGLDSLEGGEELIFGIDGCIAVVQIVIVVAIVVVVAAIELDNVELFGCFEFQFVGIRQLCIWM